MSAPVAGELELRITVGDTWQPTIMDVPDRSSVSEVKQKALALFNIPATNADAYEVKYGGARLRDESKSLAAHGVVDGGSLIVLARRRRPVR